MAAPETVLITGASSGIGREMAKLFAQDGSKLILAGRATDKMEELAEELRTKHHVEVTVMTVDLSTPPGAKDLVDQLDTQNFQIDVLINNAGFGQLGRFEDIPLQRHQDMLQLNIASLTELTYRLIPGMQKRKRGSILNIASTAAFQPGPNAAVYYASKAFVLSFSEGLYAENAEHNVWVSCMCPGPTRTGFGSDSEMENTPVFRFNSMAVEDVARAGHNAVRKRRRLVVPGWINWLGAWSVRITARPMVLWVMKQLQPMKS
ncbi:MAG: SDR family oxidoreductase [Planctomycetaceae bacterium]|nr:SDR family oxidoreductase [Planctomycetaceae bacterium]